MFSLILYMTFYSKLYNQQAANPLPCHLVHHNSAFKYALRAAGKYCIIKRN